MEGIYMVKNKILLGLLSIFVVFLMAACGNGESQPNEASQSTETEARSEEEMDMESDSGGHMEHSAGEMARWGEVPEDSKEAENPTDEVGSRTIIEAEHMQGKAGAAATMASACD